jgi:acyl-ACP thioesterase
VKHELVPLPERGRLFVQRRRVRLGDVSVADRLRLDAAARYLQDVAADDVDDVDVELDGAWVTRRTALVVTRFPRYGERVELTTFCSGTGDRWAERRTVLAVDGASILDAVAIWVYVDRDGRPARLGEWFFDHYGEAADGRRVSGRLHLPPPPTNAATRPWPLRSTDFDPLGHVNNAAYWNAVEDELARRVPGRAPVTAQLEHRAAIEPDDRVELRSTLESDLLRVWLVVRDEPRSAAEIRVGEATRHRGSRR